MNILGIETSCDETAAAVVQNGVRVLSNSVATSLKFHQKYKGVIPEIASRKQLEYINNIVDSALKEAHLTLKKIDAISVTTHPGLIGSLLVGVSFAQALSFSLKKPLIKVDHIQAHLYANFLSLKNKKKKPSITSICQPKDLPAVGLAVSGGHTSLYLIKNLNHFTLLGHTLDDAAGETFDKVARVLDLGYPGGPLIDKLSQKVKDSQIRFTSAALPDTFNFSFSGIKTAVLYHKRQWAKTKPYPTAEVAYAFQKSTVQILVKKCIQACQKHKVRTLLIGGGVAANSFLREKLLEETKENSINLYCPPILLCMDNAAMIAGLAYHRIR